MAWCWFIATESKPQKRWRKASSEITQTLISLKSFWISVHFHSTFFIFFWILRFGFYLKWKLQSGQKFSNFWKAKAKNSRILKEDFWNISETFLKILLRIQKREKCCAENWKVENLPNFEHNRNDAESWTAYELYNERSSIFLCLVS